ncbi:MAG: MFS transporter [Sphingobium sp.]
MKAARLSWLMLVSAMLIAIWLCISWVVEVDLMAGRTLAHHLFKTQDAPALLLGCGSLALGGIALRLAPNGTLEWIKAPRVIAILILFFALLAWSGRYWLFGDYALSRDEEVAEFAAMAMRHGWLAQPIPAEWIDYRRAIMPEFFSPFGANHYWMAAYLPLNAAFRALWGMVGDANLAGPAFLVIGLVALWRSALRLFPDRADAKAVTMLMALSSVQLLVTGMTPYAMTGHFALNMLWLALVLRDGRLGHAAAGLVTLALAGLHQWHYPLVFLTPFLLWFALGRRWGALLFHGAALALAVIIWAKLWPALMIDQFGPAADVRPSAGVGDKLGSLVDRLDKWHPLLHLSRFLAWNNLLVVPLALIGLWRMDWRAALRGETVALPLGLGALGMAALAIDQGYGWGYRYLHGFIGSFALLAGFGWASLRRPEPRVIWLSLLVALLTGSFLAARAHDYVAPYAASHRRVMQSGADVVLLDPRGGRYVTDVVRGRHGALPGQPVVMHIGRLDKARIDRLCDRYDVAIFDYSAFAPLGVGVVPWGDRRIAALRDHMAERNCGRLITPY